MVGCSLRTTGESAEHVSQTTTASATEILRIVSSAGTLAEWYGIASVTLALPCNVRTVLALYLSSSCECHAMDASAHVPRLACIACKGGRCADRPKGSTGSALR